MRDNKSSRNNKLDSTRPKKKINLLYPSTLCNLINSFERLYPNLISGQCNLIVSDQYLNSKSSDLNESSCIKSIETCDVSHVYKAKGVVMELRKHNDETFKLVYSGDCRPSDKLVKMGSECDLLIHEASFDESCKNEAISHKHSTIHEGE